MTHTLYWHDYETFGVDPKRDRPAQFAGVRTDEALNEIGEPLVIYCQPAADMLPHPDACVLTHITPQVAAAKGVPEPEFIAAIHRELATPGTCGLGYNTLRFDDEVTRHALYRNFYDPYAREWQHGNSRWDLIDLVRMTYALRPQGIEWPSHDDGRPSFKLEDLTAANGIGHESAHDALSDVRATIALARLIRDRQPRLFDYLFQLRNKKKVSELLDLREHTAVLHTSRMYPAETGCTTLVMPLMTESVNKNGVLVYDLRHDPTQFLELKIDALRDRLFTRSEDLPEGVARLPVKSVKINKCPALAPVKTIDPAAIERLAIDLDTCEKHRQCLLSQQEFIRRVTEAYCGADHVHKSDVDTALYDGFLDRDDRALAEEVRKATPRQLADETYPFRDPRLPELLFRYRARNWTETLNPEEEKEWREFCLESASSPNLGGSITLSEYAKRIAELREAHAGDADAQQILDALEQWGKRFTV